MAEQNEFSAARAEILVPEETPVLSIHVLFYVLIKLLLILIFTSIVLFSDDPTVIIGVISTAGIIHFLAVQFISGWRLAGLRWYFLCVPNEKNEFFEYYVFPEPFEQNPCQTNTFWLGFFLSMIFWTITSIVLMNFYQFAKAIASLINCMLEVINFYFFAQALAFSKQGNDMEPMTTIRSASSGEAEP